MPSSINVDKIESTLLDSTDGVSDIVSNKKIVGVDPTASTHLATKNYVDLQTSATKSSTNIGTAGVGVFKQEVSDVFEFKKIDAASNKIIVLDDVANNTVDIDVNQSSLDHGSISGLADDDHSQYHNDTRGDARYFQKTEHINTSSGSGDSGKPVKLNASGALDLTMLQNGSANWNANKFQGVNVSNIAPVSGQLLVYDGGSSSWKPFTISDLSLAFAVVRFTNNATATTIVSPATPVKVSATYIGEQLTEFSHISGSAIYNGPIAKKMIITCTLSSNVASNDRHHRFYVAINGAVVAASRQSNGGIAGEPYNCSLLLSTTINPSDYVEVWVENMENVDSITVNDFYMIIRERI